jgi:class 3 adenylate cyclase
LQLVPSIEEYTEAGLYDAVENAGTGRLELLEWLAEHGFTVAEMVEGLSSDSLGAMSGDRRAVPGDRLTRAAAIEMSGLAPAVFDAYVTALGFRRIDGAPDRELGVTPDEAETLAVLGGLGAFFSPDETLAILRVIGTSLGRIAEASVSMFLSDVESPHLLSGASELDLALKVHDGVGLLDGLTERLDPILRRQLLQSIQTSRRATIGQHERFRYRYAIGFVDLVGFTAISGRMDSPRLAKFIRDFEGQAHDVVNAAGGRLVKLIGDEVMFVATDPADACRAASGLMAGFGDEAERVVPRGGLAYGDVLVRGGDYYGSIVNLASRLVDEAVPQELLVTEEAALAAVGCEFAPAGRRMVKGFDAPITVRSFVGD